MRTALLHFRRSACRTNARSDPDPTLTRLLGSIESNNLVILCGAGLSIPSPSDLLSALAVARISTTDISLFTNSRRVKGNISGLANHFHGNGEFQSVFLKTLIPWNELVGEPNAGHRAIGDLLASRAASAALSTNVDPMVEQWAKGRKIAMRAAIEATEAALFSDISAPLLKLHGCIDRNREETLWAPQQLADAAVQQRLARWANWIQLNLPGRDLLVVGFWTDWGYLNEAIDGLLSGLALASVAVIDPANSATLRTRAPALWATLHNAGTFSTSRLE